MADYTDYKGDLLVLPTFNDPVCADGLEPVGSATANNTAGNLMDASQLSNYQAIIGPRRNFDPSKQIAAGDLLCLGINTTPTDCGYKNSNNPNDNNVYRYKIESHATLTYNLASYYAFLYSDGDYQPEPYYYPDLKVDSVEDVFWYPGGIKRPNTNPTYPFTPQTFSYGAITESTTVYMKGSVTVTYYQTIYDATTGDVVTKVTGANTSTGWQGPIPYSQLNHNVTVIANYNMDYGAMGGDGGIPMFAAICSQGTNSSYGGFENGVYEDMLFYGSAERIASLLDDPNYVSSDNIGWTNYIDYPTYNAVVPYGETTTNYAN